MKRTVILAGIALCLAVPASQALAAEGGGQTTNPGEQSPYTLNHAEASVFADYFRFAPGNTSSNFVGVGGRVGFNVQPNLALEGEMSYDFARNYTSTVTNSSGSSTTTTFVKSHVRPISGLFGPKLQFGRSSPFRVFVTGKLGFIDFSATNTNAVTGSTFTGAVSGVGGSGTHLAFYPGGGFEGFFGPVGLRAEVGDEIYLNNGTYNNLRVTVGPTIRF